MLTAEHQTAWKKMERLTAEEPHTPPQEVEDWTLNLTC